MADRFWVGGTGDWSDDDNHWATESNGTPGDGNLPTSSDNVYFDENSGSGTLTINQNAYCNDMDWTNSTLLNFYHNAVSPGYDINIYGSLILTSGMSFNTGYLQWFFESTGSEIIDCKEILMVDSGGWNQYITLDTAGTFTLTSNLNIGTRQLWVRNGSTFNTNNYDMTGCFYVFSGSTANLGSSIITGTSHRFYTGSILDAGTSTIYCSNGNGFVFIGGGHTFYKMIIKASTNITIEDSNTFNTLEIDVSGQSRIVIFEAGETQIVSTFSTNATNEDTLTLYSNSTGIQFTLSKSSEIVECDYLSLKDSNVTGGATWDAGVHSIDNSNNSGWIFYQTPLLTMRR